MHLVLLPLQVVAPRGHTKLDKFGCSPFKRTTCTDGCFSTLQGSATAGGVVASTRHLGQEFTSYR